MWEYLIGLDRRTAAYVPMLATEWTMREDGKAWTVKLRKGVQWHGGFGEFTAKDVVHSFERLIRPESVQANVGYWRKALARIEVVNDYEVVFHLNTVEPEWYHPASRFWDGVMISKAQFDKEGQEGLLNNPVATGPFQHAKRTLGVGVLTKRVTSPHWRVQSDWEEIEYIFAREDLSRLAALLTGAADIADDIPGDVQPEALAKGMKAVISSIPAGGYIGQFGGNYPVKSDSYNASAPLANPLVRKALNLAINRQEIIDAVFQGRYKPVIAPFADKTHPEFKPEWEAQFKENFGYDPQRARALLKEAGYPNGFTVTVQMQAQSGAPRQDDVAEAVASYWQAIGVDAKLQTIDFGLSLAEFRDRKKQDKAWVQMAVYRPPWNRIGIFNTGAGVVHGYESEFIEQKWAELQRTIDADGRIEIQRAIIDHLLKESAHFPLMWIFAEFMINPKVVAEYVTLGFSGPGEAEYARAAQK
jgi:peptide/nickel transport system substrate-binding protein